MHPEDALPLEDDPTAGDAGVLGREHVHDLLAQGNVLELSDDDDDDVPQAPSPDVPQAPRSSQHSVFNALAHGPRASRGSRPHPPEIALRTSVPRGLVAFRPSRDRNVDWPKVDHSLGLSGGRNYIRLSVTFGTSHFTCRAICTAHGGVPCSLTKSCRYSRPIGRLWAWLQHGPGMTREQHRDFAPSLEERRLARREFEALDDISDFLNAECGGPGLGEPEL